MECLTLKKANCKNCYKCIRECHGCFSYCCRDDRYCHSIVKQRRLMAEFYACAY